MKSENEIKEELNLIKLAKKQAWNGNKYPCTQTALAGIQLMAQQEILEWVLENENKQN